MSEESVHPAVLAKPPQRPWLRAFLLSSAVFSSGLIVGIVLTSAVLWQHAFNPFRRPPGFDVKQVIKTLERELQLSPEQSRELGAIFSSHNDQMKVIRDRIDPAILNELETLKKQVEGVLNPEQAKRWTERYNDLQRRFLNLGPAGRPRPPDDAREPRSNEDRQKGRPPSQERPAQP
jgi:hypothetical protein